MKKPMIYLFNPDNDLALANGDTNYMAPASARQMATDLALLPVWYAEPDSHVLAPSAYNLSFLKMIKTRFPLEVELVTEPELSAIGEVSVSPWGWNPALVKRLSVLGLSEEMLPTQEQLQAMRQLSHRQRAVELLPTLQLSEHFCGESAFLTREEEWRYYVENRGESLLKAPLSGSGKGLNWCRGTFTPYIAGWCTRVAASQGGVIAEPIYNKVEDFAMEFRIDAKGRVTFAGYSLFATGAGGAYEKNLLLSDTEIERRLSVYVLPEALHVLRYRLEEELARMIGTAYQGYLGIDMMICRFPGAPEYRIHPCVEINLRMNMGVVSRLLYDRYVHPVSTGEFHITYHAAPGEALAQHEQAARASALQVEEGRVRKGYLPLTPVSKHTHYRAWLFC